MAAAGENTLAVDELNVAEHAADKSVMFPKASPSLRKVMKSLSAKTLVGLVPEMMGVLSLTLW